MVGSDGARITVVGGGSAYCAGLIQSFIKAGEPFAGVELALTDINAERLELIAKLGRNLARAAGSDLRISASTDLERMVEGATVVLTSYRPGGLAARALDERIPLEFGVIGQETVGPGGFFMALRSIPVLRTIVSAMERHAPGAVLLNYANPTNIVTQAATRLSTKNPVVGLCDGPWSEMPEALEAAGMRADPGAIVSDTRGLNHGSWTTSLKVGGEELLPSLIAGARRVIDDPEQDPAERRKFRLLERYGALPSHYWQYYAFPREVVAAARAKPTTRAQDIMAMLPNIWEHYAEQAEAEHPHLEHTRGGHGFGDMAVEISRCVLHDTGERWILNVPNQGAIPGLPDDRVVEVPCTIGRLGATPLKQPPLPDPVSGHVQMLAQYQLLTSRLGLEGGRREGVQALASNPLVLDVELASELYDALATAHRAHLEVRLLA